MIEIRNVRAADLDALYHVALATGDGGGDAAALYRDPKLLGHIYAAPYAVLSPDTVFVAEDADGVGGYIVGAADTRAFEDRLEVAWWPDLRTAYPAPWDVPRANWTRDERMINLIHQPRRTPEEIAGAYPSHLHINLLPRLRGLGVGRAMMDRWLRAVRSSGSIGVHLAVGTTRTGPVRFYHSFGFRELTWPSYPAAGAMWMVRQHVAPG